MLYVVYIVLGCLGFVFLYIFALNKVINLHKYLNLCFALGFLLLAVSAVLILLVAPPAFPAPFGLQIIFALLAAISLALLTFPCLLPCRLRKPT